MPVERLSPSHQRKIRVSAACDFCRKRKLGCDNAEPKCGSCRRRGNDCTYATRIKQSRPSNARINNLEAENARLRRSLQQNTSLPLAEERVVEDTSGSTPQYSQAIDVYDRASSEEEEAINVNHEPRAAALVSDGYASAQTPQDTAFHGPSSVLFDAPRKEQQPSSGPSMAHVRDQLLAHATRQRHFELLNKNNESLDFDGVPAELGMRLLSFFWNRQHYIGPIIYRPVFMRDMASGGPYFSKLLLNAIYFGASKNLSRSDDLIFSSAGKTTGWYFREKFENYLHSSGSKALWKSEITTVQALLIVSDALFTWCDERSLSWHYMGIAVNMIVDLGIHVDGSAKLCSKKESPEDLEVHRRLFWSAYVIDKVQSVYQGRPARLRDMDNNVPILFSDEYEEFEPFNTLTYSANPEQLARPTYSVSTFQQLCRLSIIMDRILCSIYAEKSSSKGAADLLSTSQSLQEELEKWKKSLPAHLSVQLDAPILASILPHTLSLLSMYNSLIILLNRPFVSDGHLQPACSPAASHAFTHCALAALDIDKILRLYQKHFCMKTTPYFVSYATYVSATIHVRIAAQRQPNSAAHKRLQTCLNVLAEHQAFCHAPRQTMRILKSLIARLGVKVKHIPEPVHSDCSNGTGPETLEGIEPSMGITSPPATATPLVFEPEANQSDFDSGFLDLDIDEIMRSFEVAPNGPLPPLNAHEPFDRQTTPLAFGVDAAALYKPSGDPSARAGNDNNPPMDSNSLIILDPLFGFDSAF